MLSFYSKKQILTLILGTFLVVSSLSALQAFGDDDEDEGREHGGYSERHERGGEEGERGEREEGGEDGEMEGRLMTAANPAWKTECSSCHVAYPPGLLPKSSWVELMKNLDKHFGTDASLDDKTMTEILTFLQENAAPESLSATTQKPVLRITETRWFKNQHDEVSDITWKKVKNASNCAACHTSADKGDFSEDNVTLPK